MEIVAVYVEIEKQNIITLQSFLFSLLFFLLDNNISAHKIWITHTYKANEQKIYISAHILYNVANNIHP